MTIQLVTRELADQVLARVETGTTTVADANLLRAYLGGLESRLEVYELGDDRVVDG